MGLPKLCTALTWAVALTSSVIPLVEAQALPGLRIMPLGDSITQGSGSTDKNGYRNRLRQKLLSYESDGDVSVDMIGSIRNGTMTDNDHEGHSGKYLADINQYWKLSVQARPNVVLIHAGTNNMDKEVDLDVAPDLFESIIEGLWGEAPDATIIVTPVIWANDERMNANTDRYNEQIGAIIDQKKGAGKHILATPVDITLGDLSDKKHPNDAGYEKMATAWFKGILTAHENNWLDDPAKVDPDDLPGMGLGTGGASGGSGDGGCKGGNWEKKGQIFDGFRVWEEVGTIIEGVENARRDKVILADLNDDGIADYILADDDGTVRAWINKGKPKQWTSLGKINPDWSSVKGSMVRMADADGDGKADMIALYDDGAARLWRNIDNGSKFNKSDSEWASGLESSEKIHFKDMDGDGYADYVILYEGGSVKWARNTGNNGENSDKRNWDKEDTIAPGPAGVPDNRARLYDLDGDGMTDYLVVYDGGAVKAWRNTGSLNGDGKNWNDIGTIAPGVPGVTGDMIQFADMDGDGLADFLAVAEDGSIKMWKNLGVVGSKGSSMRFADLTGDGKADIVSVDDKGRAQAWLNKGVGKWESIGEISPGFDEDLSDSRIEFADLNGDELDDFIVIYGGGAAKVWLNNGNIPDKGKDRIWQTGLVISEGVGEPGRKIQFADLNGDGYADFLVVFDGSAVDCYLNRKNIPPDDGGRIWEHRTTVATGVGESGDKVRFADITGDGKAEYVIQYNGGAAKGYNNTGNIPDVGKVRNWYDMGTIAGGVNPQGPVRYADIDGDGKDDYLVVFGSGTVNAYINICDWKATGPDDGDGGDGDGGDDDDGGLNGDSTCKELQEEGGAGGTYDRSIWNEVGATGYWRWWLSYEEDASENVVGAFAQDWGFDNVACPIEGNCDLPNTCAGYNKEKGSARAHVIMRSLNNLHSYYKALKEAIDSTKSSFAILQSLFEEYYPEPDLEDVALKTLLGVTDTIWGMGAGIAGGGVKTDLASSIFSTISGLIESSMEANSSTLDHANQLAVNGFNFLNSSVNVIYEMHDQLLNQGHFEGDDGSKIVIDDIFNNGKWLDTSMIPILNKNKGKPQISSQRLGNWFFDFLHASVLNYSWKNSIVFITGFKMSKEEFDENSSDVDENLKAYHDGKGFFLQSYEAYRSLGEWEFRTQDVPGYDAISGSGLTPRFGVPDVIKSSVDTFNQFGYNYTDSTWLSDVITDPDWEAWEQLTPRTTGTFSIPVCVLDEDDTDLDYFFERVNDQGDAPTTATLLCMCEGKEDKDGRKFWDEIMYSDDIHYDCEPSTGPGT